MEPITIIFRPETTEARDALADLAAKARDTFERAYVTGLDKVQAKYVELNRKQREVIEILDANKKKIEELSQAKDRAAGDERARIDKELENLKRITNGREVELLKIQEKKLKLEEVGAINAAASDKEVQDIKRSTQERTVANKVLQDQQRAQQGVTDAVADTDKAMNKFATGALTGVAAVMAVLRQMSDQLRAARQEAQEMVDASGRFGGLQENIFEQDQPALSALGLQGSGERSAAHRAISAMQNKTPLRRRDIVGPMAALAPILNSRKIGWDSDRGQGFAEQASLLAFQGMAPQQLANLLDAQLSANPQTTPTEFAQTGSNVIAAMGSPSEANAFLETFQMNKPAFDAVGLSFDDVLKAGVATNQMGDRAARQRTLRQLGQGMDRAIGLSPTEALQKFKQELNITTPSAKAQEEAFSGRDPMTQFQHLKQFSAVPQLNPFFEQAIGGKPVDYRAMFKVIASLPEQQQERAAHALGGSRNAVAFLATAAAGGVQLPQGDLPQAPNDPGYLRQVQRERADVEAMGRGTAIGAYAPEAVTQEMNRLAMNPEDLPLSARKGLTWGPAGDLVRDDVFATNVGTVARNNVMTYQAVKLARLRQQINAGQVTLNPLEKINLQQTQDALISSLGLTGHYTPEQEGYQTLDNLIRGAPEYLDEALGQVTNDRDFAYKVGGSLSDQRTNQFVPERAQLETINRIDSLVHRPSPATRPSTQPSTRPATRPSTQPVSINYHSYNVNYGYAHDSIGNVNDTYNRYG